MLSNKNNFNEKCYELLKLIPAGKITTYKEMSAALHTKAWRAVGTAMAKNKNLFIVPCHRVIRSDGVIGQYALGTDKKIELLLNEGISITKGKVNDIEKYIFRFSA